MIVSHRLRRLSRSFQVGVICAFIIIGTMTSLFEPTWMPLKPCGRHADDRHRMAIDDERAIDHRGIAAETALPEPVAEDCDRMRPRRAVVGIVEHAPEGRTHAEDVEVVAADDVAVDALGAALARRSSSPWETAPAVR